MRGRPRTSLAHRTFVGFTSVLLLTSCVKSITEDDAAGFWALITRVRVAPATGEAHEGFREELDELSDHELRAFTQHWSDHMALAADDYVWDAVELAECGCSDDCFYDLRTALIMLGEADFHRLVQHPDEFVDLIGPGDRLPFGSIDWSIAVDEAWHARFPHEPSPGPRVRAQAGETEHTSAQLSARLPRLSARRKHPLR